jgi:replication factor C small subunit
MDWVWAEKYRPKTLDEIINQKHVVERLKAFVKDKNIPHCLFAGPPGTGKTTATFALAHDLYGENWRQNLLELNASVTPDTPILIRRNGKIMRTNFAELEREFDDDEKYARVKDLEILSLNKENKVEFLPVSLISRHRVNKIAEIAYEGGKVKTSLNHSVIVIDDDGNLKSKMVSELSEGDLLITFKATLPGSDVELNLEKFEPQLFAKLKSGIVRNPKVKRLLKNTKLNKSLAWLLGLYLAEGCTSLSSRQTIFTFGYPSEMNMAEEVQSIIKSNFDLPSSSLNSSGFNRNNFSSIQVRILNTQLTKFLRENFYQPRQPKTAKNKRVPSFIFLSTLENRLSFLKGYMGDGFGEWNSYVRYISSSRENLIDIAWLGRISGLDTSVFEREARIVWKKPTFSYLKSEFVPSMPYIKFLEKIGKKAGFNWRYELRHQLYHKKSKRISKQLAKRLLEKIDLNSLDENEREEFNRLINLIDSDISVVKIKKIKIKEYDGFVYDVSVPGSEMFWGGTTPVLLHNSDERGIDVIRGKVKDFARTKAISDIPFKIIMLDEADALTADAQHALRRTMEAHAATTRFILICNYSSKIIEPIQSRCSVFRFKPLSEDDVKTFIQRIVKNEKLQITEDAIKAVIALSEGDLRRVANTLQASASIKEKITEDVVYEAVSQAKPKDVKNLLEYAFKGDLKNARRMLHDLFFTQGLAAEDIIKEMHRQIFDLSIPEEKKMEAVKILAEYDFRIAEGGNEFIQLEAALAQLMLIK